MLNFEIDAASRVGLIRKNNEDMILVGDRMIRNGIYHTFANISGCQMYIVALADGIGGHKAGEKASELVLGSLRHKFSMPWKYLDACRFNEAAYYWLDHVSRDIANSSKNEPLYSGMGTTLVGLAVNYNDLYWVNCGDSRIYLYRNDKLTQLSTDHSLNNILGDTRHNGIIVNCIGGGCDTSYLDLVEFRKSASHGDIYLLCSDGLTDMLSDEDISHYLLEGATADQLCQYAEDAGGYDNVSVCLVTVL